MHSFFVEGRPAPQGSKTPTKHGFRESSKLLPAWRKAIITEAKKAVPVTIEGAVHVGVDFVFPRPKRLIGKPTEPFVSPPDTDKLQRAVGDALTIAGAIQDDRFIVTWLNPHKRYAEDGETPGAHITISPVRQQL